MRTWLAVCILAAALAAGPARADLQPIRPVVQPQDPAGRQAHPLGQGRQLLGDPTGFLLGEGDGLVQPFGLRRQGDDLGPAAIDA